MSRQGVLIINMNVDQYLEEVLKCHPLTQPQIKLLCRAVIQLLVEQSNLQPVQAPVTVVGDVHGQFYDVLELFRIGGELPDTRYIMIGDFVDRGYHSVQTISLLFCYKIKYPDRLTLLRGNHECRNITLTYGFYDEISKKYGNCSAWKMFNQAFDYLPISAIIEGKVFCVHGGLSPSIKTLDQICGINRRKEIPESGALCDMMWSDPLEIQEWEANKRGVGWYFGLNPTEMFLQRNNLIMIARAHQLVAQGYYYWFQKKLVTVWSAPNYCYRVGNKAAIMKLSQNLERQFMKFETTPQSKSSEDYRHILPYFL